MKLNTIIKKRAKTIGLLLLLLLMVNCEAIASPDKYNPYKPSLHYDQNDFQKNVNELHQKENEFDNNRNIKSPTYNNYNHPYKR
ncbi:hypothetical protein [Chryseobacterium sp.]|uniref:hypothetical protein n=1 Tax=Chryseobacterium sp. TaxID=1871047 RepID=UPI0025C0BD53|nr:hypothetical protein [Chryseobacterium sp.]MBV8325185.1 hypothetical protein [Chryseobacterium sp.]